MKNFALLAAVALFAALDVNANVLYVATTSAGKGDGSSWDNALGITADLDNYVGGVGCGDIAYLKEGTYTGKRITINPGATFIGGFPKDATGTDISGYNPWVYKTIIDAQKQNTTDASRQALIKVNNMADDGTPTTLKGITITHCVGANSTTYFGSAVNTVAAHLVVEDVVFKDNESYMGACVIPSEGSNFYAKHCVWTGNKANTGTASCLTVRGTEGKVTNAVLEGCVMVNNSVYAGMGYGGYINAADSYTNLMMVNCYADGGGQSIKQNGGCVRTGKDNTLHFFAFNTFCNFKCTDATPKGHIMSINNTNGLYFQGNIVTSDYLSKKNDDTSVNALYFQNSTATKYDNVKSYGYNTVTGTHFLTTSNVGTFRNNATGTDDWLAPVTADVFGSNKMTEKDGRYYVEPLAKYRDVDLEEVLKNFENFDIPSCFSFANFDLSLDLFGNRRDVLTYRGAYDPNAVSVSTSAIESVTDRAKKLTVTSLGNGNFAITGAEGNAEVYDLSGRLVSKQTLSDGTLQLENAASGIYLVRVANTTLKLAR